MLGAGLLVYSGVVRDMADFAGVYDQDDWFTVEDRVQRFKPLFNDEYGGHLIGELVATSRCAASRGSEYHMSTFSGAPGDMWSIIPYSVLADDEWTSGVGPIRGDGTSLPRKTGLYTTSQGKLTQDDCNERARAFVPSTLQDGLVHLDDTWLKHHPDDPRAQDLYRRTQQHSVVLKDKGAGLRREDIAALRQEAGREAG